MDRRTVLRALVGTSALSACRNEAPPVRVDEPTRVSNVEAVLRSEPLTAAPWRTQDPFLFCVHHDDAYPAGNERLGPAASLEQRDMGNDFSGREGWSMYHGDVVPGFPQHPHRGFETVTLVRRGLVDHADSLGAAARYGQGDVQWLTAGKGIVHAEMFPLLSRTSDNPLELFQIWLNLPREDKLADPHFTMFWAPSVPKYTERDSSGHATEVTVVAGGFGAAKPPAPPPKSWAARPDTEVVIATFKMEPGAVFTLPKTAPGTNRTLYLFRGSQLQIGGHTIAARHLVELRAATETVVRNGPEPSEILLLQGRAIGQPVAQRGPFVMNTREEIQQAYSDYRQTGFGGWPWQNGGPIHGTERQRFARHADGRVEHAG